MNLEIIRTPKFEKALRNLGARDREHLEKRVEFVARAYKTDSKICETTYFHRPFLPTLPGGLTSSLYMVRVAQRLRLFLSVEDDPIFERTTITLHDAMTTSNYHRAFQNAASDLSDQYFRRVRKLAHDHG